MRISKSILKSAAGQWLASRLAAFYIRLVWKTTRWAVEPSAAAAAVVDGGGPVIACLWHSRMLLTMPIKPVDRPVHILISSHRDGQLISAGMARLGLCTIAGSSRRGGASALRQMKRILDQRGIVVITPDGPRGPALRAKGGALKAAQLTGAPIIPLGAATSRRRLLGSWDRFFLPYPFGRGLILLGDPIKVARHADDEALEQARAALEAALNRLTEEADRRCDLALDTAPARGDGQGGTAKEGAAMPFRRFSLCFFRAFTRAPDFWRVDGWRARLLAPVAFVWRHLAQYRAGRPARGRVTVPILCVGNLVAGGAGKTPVALSLLERLGDMGRRPHAVTRGYGGSLRGPLRVDTSKHRADQVGDEALLLATMAPTWVARDRVAGARRAVEQGADLILLDDGFQDPSLHKDLSFLVVDGDYGWGNERIMPAGPLREAPDQAIRRADAMIMIGSDRHGLAARYGLAARCGARLPLLRAKLVPTGAAHDVGGKAVLAFAGIGRPEKFFASLAQAGANIVARHAYPDHHPYRREEVIALLDEAARLGAIAVTTQKDAVRLPAEVAGDVATFPIEVEWEDGDGLATLLREGLKNG